MLINLYTYYVQFWEGRVYRLIVRTIASFHYVLQLTEELLSIVVCKEILSIVQTPCVGLVLISLICCIPFLQKFKYY